MKKTKSISKMLATAVLTTVASLPSFAQNNLGASCGCPPVASRGAAVNISSLPQFNSTTNELSSVTLGCDKIYSLDKRVHVPSGQTLTINPGALIKGEPGTSPATETALIIERGGRIEANGTEECPIVFTAKDDDLSGSYSLNNKGKWGGVVILGKATNNLTLAKNGPPASGKLCVRDGLGTIEGFNAPTNSKYWYGADLTNGESFNDNDNSGILKYVSIRFAGAILEVGNEINSLTLGSVGRGTTIDHIEIIAGADDDIEFFGGTVNVKYIASLYGNDDIFDWDQGYTGKAQFVFGLKAPNTFALDSDNGFESDGDDNRSNNTPRSHPVIYNVTMIGNNKSALTADNSALAGINARDYTEGEIYNSVFANFRRGLNMTKTLVAPRTAEAYDNWIAGSLIIKCNTFLQAPSTSAFTLDVTGTPSASDLTKFNTTDANVTAASIAGFNPTFAVTLPATITTAPDVIPNPALSNAGCPTPSDGFLTPAPYRGAFASTGQGWLSDFAYLVLTKPVIGVAPCPTDVTGDGATTNADLSQILLQFGKNCQ